MKDLIEMLERIKNKMSLINTKDILDSVILLIKEKESKAFNPLEKQLGFELNNNIYTKIFSDDFVCNLQKCYTDEFKWYLILYKNEVLNPIITLMIKIPNHRQGVELLRNLGVIDAD